MARIRCLLLTLVALGSLAQAQGQTRALWVTRWDYATPQDIRTIVTNAANLGFNTLLFQVRGNATVTYPSTLEPWDKSFDAPDWDPLQTAIEEAHDRNLKVHAWVNVYPGWRGEEPPDDSTQVYHTHPAWFMYDLYGRRQEINDHYLWLAPTNPFVIQHNLRVCEEIYSNYDIDGLHLDYIRYPGVNYSYDPISLHVFEHKYGATPEERPGTWDFWRRQAITVFLQLLHENIKSTKPRLVISAAVISEPDRRHHLYYQDAYGWLSRGYIDVIYPMLYTRDSEVFRRLLQRNLHNHHNRHVYPGITLEYGDLEAHLNICQDLEVPGMAIFSYKELAPEHRVDSTIAALLNQQWEEEIQPAELPWKLYLGDAQGPLIRQISTIPDPVTADQPFRVAAKISDPSGVYEGDDQDKGIRLRFGRTWPPTDSVWIDMRRIEKTEDWYITDDEIPGQELGLDAYVQITAYDNYHESANNPKRNAGFSDVTPIAIVQPDSSYRCEGEIGPIVWSPSALATDHYGRIWVNTSRHGPLIVFDADGDTTDFSPLRFGIDGRYDTLQIDSVVGITRGAHESMVVGCNTEPPMLLRFDAQTGRPLPGIELNFKIGDVASDEAGNLYVLERFSTRFLVLSATGIEYEGSPYGGGHTGTDIIVSENGARIYIVDRTADTVQQWHGAVEGRYARYWQVNDVPLTQDIGLGTLALHQHGELFVCHSQRGLISMFGPRNTLVGHLQSEHPRFVAPRQVAFSPGNDRMYSIEVVGHSPTRVLWWSRPPKE